MGILLDSFVCLDPERELQNADARRIASTWEGKANSFRWSSGMHPGRGWVLLLRRDLDALNKDGLHTLTFDDGQGGRVQLRDILFVRARNVSPGFAGDPDAAYLCELADVRHLAWNPFYSTPVNKQYNVRAPAGGAATYYADSLNAGSAWTWQTMLDSLWSIVNVSQLGTSPTLPFTPDGTPEGWKFLGISAWAAYHQVLDRIGCVLTLNPFAAQSPAIARRGATSTGLTAALERYRGQLLLDDEPIEGVRAKVPAKVRVFFHRFHSHYGTEQTTITTSAQWSTTPVQTVDVVDPNATAGVQSNSFAVLYDDLPALVDFSGTVTNSAALTTRATERAADYYRQIATGGDLLHKTYSGVIKDTSLLPGAQLSGIAWCLLSDGYKTEIIDVPEPLRVDDAGQWAWPMPASEHLQLPNLGRKTHPNYPLTLQVVEITGTSATANIYDGFVERCDPGGPTFSDAEACWIRPLTTSPAPANGFYLAKLNGTFTVSGTTRPLYLATNSMGRAFSGAQVEISAGLSVTSSTTVFTAVSWGTEIFDTDNYWTNGSPLDITFPEVGYYLVVAHAEWPSVANMQTELRVTIAPGGYSENDRRRTEGTAYAAINRVAAIFYSSGFSTILTDVRQDSGASQTIAAGKLRLTITKLGT